MTEPTPRPKMRTMRPLLLLGVLMLALVACSAAHTKFNYAALRDPSASPYRIQAGDRISVRVLRNEANTGVFTVRPDGYISLPLGGEIRVMGRTIADVRQEVVARLRRYIEDAEEMISISLDHVYGVRYSVIGEVQRAGMFETPRYVTLLEALANAGGLTPYANPEAVYVLRQQGSRQVRIPVSYPRTLRDPSHNRNFYLLSGDVVVVP